MWWTSCWRPGRSSTKYTRGPAQQKEPSSPSGQPTGQTKVTDGSFPGSSSDVRSSGASREAEQANPLQNARPGPSKQNSLRKALVRQQTAGDAQPAPGSGEAEVPRGSGNSAGSHMAKLAGNWPRSAPSQQQQQQQAPVSPARPAAAAAAIAAAGGVRQAQASPNAAGNQRLPTLAASPTEQRGLPMGRPSLNDVSGGMCMF